MLKDFVRALSASPVKLLHKQLLAVCLPYLVLIAGAWIVVASFLEPFERKRIQFETTRELNLYVAQIRQNIERAASQLRLMAERPVFREGDTAQRLAELTRLNTSEADSFAAVYFHAFKSRTLDAQGTTVSIVHDERPLEQGKTVVTDLRDSVSKIQPTFFIMVPFLSDAGQAVFVLIGELPAQTVLPMLDPKFAGQPWEFSFSDAQGREIGMSQIASTLASQFQSSRNIDLASRGMEVYSVEIPPWNWRLRKYVTDRQGSIGALRFLRNLFIAMCLGGMILSAAGVIWRQRTTNRRLTTLTETLQLFGASDPTARSRDLAADELGRLAEAFNCMADDVLHSQRLLQKQLAEHQQSPGQWKEQVERLQQQATELQRYDASVAHEFQAPLVTLQGYLAGLEQAAQAGDWDRFRGDVSRIQQTTQELRGTAEALLILAKTEPGTLIKQSVSLHQAAAEAEELLHGPLTRRGIHVAISADLPTVSGHPVLLRQVFQNLIDNALKACTGVAEPKIEIGCERNADHLVYFVRDNGSGLDPQAAERLFDSTQPPSGLGLRLVQRIVELHGGKVWAESEGKGRGTTAKWTTS